MNNHTLAPLSLSAKTMRRLTEPETHGHDGATALVCQTSLITITISVQFCSDGCPPASATGGYSCAKIGACCEEPT